MNRPIILSVLILCVCSTFAANPPKPDIVVAADGSGNFKTIQEAVQSVPATNHERVIVLIKNGTYREQIRVDASFVTLRGESRAGTRIEFPQLNEDFDAHSDEIDRAVINVNGDDFVLENLTAENTAGIIGPRAFAVHGKGDRTVIVDCDVLSHGADTVSLWLGDRGRYYHARCNFRGAVDFEGPRGWCYVTDCNFYEYKNTAVVRHDGKMNQDMKFVMRNCDFDGTNGFTLGRHRVDGQFYFLNCNFSAAMADRQIKRVIYPSGSAPATEADIKRNADLDKQNLWGEREYFYNCHRKGGDFDWFANNLSTAPGSPQPKEITAEWTFAGKWNPEAESGPTIVQMHIVDGQLGLVFSENVTVKGHPRLRLRGGGYADYVSGSGTDTIFFVRSAGANYDVRSVDLNDGAIIATEAAATLRPAELSLRAAQKFARKLQAPAPTSTPPYGHHLLSP